MTAEWNPTRLLREVEHDVWEMRHPSNPHAPYGQISRMELGPYRETWFRATGFDGAELGVSHDVEQMAWILYRRGVPSAQDKPFPGYPPTSPTLLRSMPADGSR